MFKPYTWKQWNKDPCDLDPSVLGRIPIRDNFDTRYFSDKYQALPEMGYTYFFEKLLSHSNITVDLGVDFFNLTKEDLNQYQGIIYTGPIDQFFKLWTPERLISFTQDKSILDDLNHLEYRSIDFKIERFMGMGYYQPNSVVNYPELKYPYTRIVEYKHFPNSCHPDNMNTVIVSESTNDHGEPYYPVPTQRNMDLYVKYQRLAEQLSAEYPIHFLGRLATYKYYNMDQAIRAALDLTAQQFE
jgi:UDP-galactopyranose mutase